MGDRILVGGEQLTAEQVAQYALNAGFTPDEAAQLVAIAQNESGFNAGILNDTPATGDYSVGLYQINYYGNLDQGRTTEFGTPSQLAASPQAQSDAAYSLYKQSGWAPWAADFRNGTAQANLPAGRQAVAAAQQAGGGGGAGIGSGTGMGQTSGALYQTTSVGGDITNALGESIPIVGAIASIFGGASKTLSAGEKAVRLMALLMTAEPWIRLAEVVAGGVLALNTMALLTVTIADKSPVAKIGKGPLGFLAGDLLGKKTASAARTAPARARRVSLPIPAAPAPSRPARVLRQVPADISDEGDELFEATRGAGRQNRHYYRQVVGTPASRPRGAGMGARASAPGKGRARYDLG